jgi:Phytanoyl-CoA dioxygenase (PhyH)
MTLFIHRLFNTILRGSFMLLSLTTLRNQNPRNCSYCRFVRAAFHHSSSSNSRPNYPTQRSYSRVTTPFVRSSKLRQFKWNYSPHGIHSIFSIRRITGTTSTQLHVNISPNPQNYTDFNRQPQQSSSYRSQSTMADTPPTGTLPLESDPTTTMSTTVNHNTFYHPTPDENNNNKIKMEMTDRERYLFDLNGYIVIPNVLSNNEVQDANIVIDRHVHLAIERTDDVLRNAMPGSNLYGTGPGRQDLGRILEWGPNDSRIFASILNHPRLVPLFHGLLGKGYRMDHLPFGIVQDYGSEGFQLHGGTIDCISGEYNPHLAYTCHHNMIRTALLGCSLVLTDHNAGDGGFCVVPGSHKSNFQMPPGMVDGTDAYREYIHQPITKAGDVVLFSEGTVHGALPWTPQNRQRRICLYRFAPATNAYGRSYFGSHSLEHTNTDPNKVDQHHDELVMGWPKAMYEGLTDGQRAVLEPPYANRLDRPNLNVEQNDVDTIVMTTRNERKKQHDRNVFGTKYF